MFADAFRPLLNKVKYLLFEGKEKGSNKLHNIPASGIYLYESCLIIIKYLSYTEEWGLMDCWHGALISDGFRFNSSILEADKGIARR